MRLTLSGVTGCFNLFWNSPTIYSLVYSCYLAPSSFFWEGRVLESGEGVQQGDPLGPLLFCLAIHIPSLQLHSDLCIMYLDDIILGGAVEDLLQDLNVISSLEEIGLSLNSHKSDVLCSDHAV